MKHSLKKALSMLLALIMMIGLVPVSAYASEDVGEEVCTHSWDAGVIAEEASCAEEGSIVYTCTLCGETKTETLAALGHAWGDWAETVAPTCTEAGEHTHACTREGCEAVETVAIDAIGHAWGEWSDEVAPSCTEAGEHTHACTREGCEAVETVAIPALGHAWGEWTDEVAPTCAEAGEHTHACTREGCEAVETVAIDALGHSWGEWTDEAAPTCTEEGSHTHACTVCGETETVAIEAKGHVWGEDNGVDPVTCTVCGELKLIADGGAYDIELDGDLWILAGDPNADVETAALWDAMFAGFERTGDWAEDLVAAARTQVGYRESARNYLLNAEGERRGYSRYGAWNGIPYGDWCAMFLSFCLHYAGIPAEAMPREAGCAAWINALDNAGLYVGAGEYRPKAGDLIFYDEKGDGVSDHVGLVTSYDAGSGVIGTVEGNLYDAVAAHEVGVSDSSIVGYGLLPEQPAADTREQRTLTAELGEQTVTVEGLLPADAELVVVAVPAETAAAIYEKQTGEKVEASACLFAGDVSILSGGKKYEPEDFGDSVRVTVSNTKATQEKLDVLHVKVDVRDAEGGLDEAKLNSLLAEEAEKELLTATAADGAIVFDTASFTAFMTFGSTRGAAGTITISSSDYTEGQTEYTMSEVGDKGFSFTYSNGSGTDSTVLVVEGLEYGAIFSAVPGTGEVVQEVATHDAGAGDGQPRIILLRLADNSAEVEYFASFSFSHVPLTDAQAGDLIDNNMPAARIAVTEYKYSGELSALVDDDGNLITEGRLNQKVYCSPKPTTSDTTVEATHGYRVGVSPIAAITNRMLSNQANCSWHYNSMLSYSRNNTLREWGLRFRLPEAYTGSPVEIIGIKIFAPDERIALTSLVAYQDGVSNYWDRGNDLYYLPYDAKWSGWRISDTGTEGGRTWYMLSPPEGTRVFNNGQTGKTEYFCGLSPVWQLKDESNPLDYLADGISDFQAPNSTLYYKLPGDTSPEELSFVGPLIQTWAEKTRNVTHSYNAKRNKNIAPRYITDLDVIVGSIQRNEVYNSVYNSGYMGPGVPRTQFVPAYMGPLKQTYEFPYQIQPIKFSLRSTGQVPELGGEYSALKSITWTAWDGTVQSITPDEVTAINNAIKRGSYDDLTLKTLTIDGESPIKTIEIEWDRLTTEYRWGCRRPTEDMPSFFGVFDYRVNNWTDETESATLPDYELVQVKYKEDYDGVYNDGATYYDDNYLWFRLKPQIDPDLWECALNRVGYPYLNDESEVNFARLAFVVGQYGERRDTIHDPVITFTMTCSGLTGVTNEQSIAFLSGAFTAMPRLAGWYFEYTTKNHGDEVLTYTISGDIPAAGRAEQIPLEPGDCFTSLKLRYDGDADLSHGSENDTYTQITMMDNIKLQPFSTNPFTGETVHTTADYSTGTIYLRTKVFYDDCICSNHTHLNGQAAKTGPGQGGFVSPYKNVWSTRREGLSAFLSGAPENTTIYQGDSTSATYDLRAPIAASLLYGDNWGNGTNNGPCPWENIREAIYIELTDDEFSVDLDNTYFYGFKATSSGVNSEIVYKTSEGVTKKFLKMQFVENFVRSKWWCLQPGYVGWYNSSVHYGWTDNKWMRWENQSFITAAAPCTIAFKTLPGTQLGNHQPIGDILLDFSELLVKYQAPEATGYDLDRTKFIFTGSNVVEDTFGLSSTSATGQKLFLIDGSSYTVKVELSLDAGVELAPGKYDTLWDFAPRVTAFRTGEENNLNALATFKGPGNESANTIFDMNGIIVLPREGKAIRWIETVMQDGQPVNIEHESTGDWDLFLRGAPVVVTNSTGNDPHYAYTTAADPTAEGVDWGFDPTAQGNSWRDVTGVRVILDTVPPLSSMNLRLDLCSDVKSTVEVKKALGGGTYRFLRTETDTTYVTGCLQLCEWDYENYTISSGQVFWDVYDENGVRTIRSGNAYQPTESLISGLKVYLYDANDNLIQQPVGGTLQDYVETGADGKFPTLQTYSNAAGQYIVIETPTAPEGQTWVAKLTKKINASPTQSAVDSDFDRDTNKLVLGTIGANGLTNVSAGFVKLPQLAADDVTLSIGETADAVAVLTEYLRTALPGNSYNVTFSGAANPAIATLGANNEGVTVTLTNADTGAAQEITATAAGAITAVGPGETTVTVTVTNKLGDEVTTTFKIIVGEQISITVNKIWNDNNDQDGIRPTSISLQLKADGTAVGEAVTLSATGTDDAWQAADLTHTWSDLERYTAAGTEINYSVEESEIQVPSGHATGYSASYEKSEYDATNKSYTITVTNTHTPEKVSKSVTKVWEDGNDQDAIRPTEQVVQLKVGNTLVQNVTVKASENWTATVSNLDKYANGELIVYTWGEENPANGYTLTGQSVSGDTTTLTNTHTPETMNVKVTKTWADNDNQDGVRPASITLQLMKKIGSADAAPYGEAVTLSASGTGGAWQPDDLIHTWTDVPRYSGGTAIDYSIVETAIPAQSGHATGYTASFVPASTAGGTYDDTISGYAIALTNTHTPEKVSKTVAKVWDDNNNQDGKRPTSLSVQLKADGTAVEGKTVTLNVSNEWTGTIEGLDKYAAGTAIVYSWDEGTIADYTLSSTSVSGDTTTLTNTHTPETKRITVTKVWADRNDLDDIRPESVALTVTGSDGKTYRATLNGTGSTWSTEVEVAKYWNDNGTCREVTFTADEPNVPAGYTKSVSGLTVTNTHEPNVTITYKLNGGRYPYMGSTEDIIEVYPKGSTITIHARPYRTGYVFLYWKGSAYQPGDPYVANEDHVFVAQWQRRNPWSPATGDHTPWLPWLGVLLLSGTALGADALIRRRKRRRDED